MNIANPIVQKINTEDIGELDVMQIDEAAAGEEDLKLWLVGDEVHQRREKRREQGQHTSNLESLPMNDQQNQIAQLQKENFSALRRQIEQVKVILDNIPVKECIQETEVETAQKMTLLLIYKLYCRMEREIIALHSTPSLLSYSVMVERIVRIKEILKDNYGMDELENESYGQDNNIHSIYKTILNIERRMEFLSALAIANTEEAVRRLMNHRLDPGEYCDLNSKININNLPLNPNSGILHWENKRIEFVWECAKRLSKVGYFMGHKCTYTFLTKMYEKPDELLTIFSQQEWETHLEEYEMLLHQERFVQAAAINHAWEKREENNENIAPDFELCRVRALHSLRDAGKGFFEMFEDVIDTKPIYDGGSERGKEYGTNCMAYLCYVEAKQVDVEQKWAYWQACRMHREFSEWKDIDMEVRDMPGLGKIRREISAIREELIPSSNN